MIDVNDAIAKLRDAGLRVTPQRRVVIEVLAGDTSHPNAENIAARVAQRMPGISMSTVYKTLHEFADVGLVRELEVGGAMRFDPDASDHAHLVCSECATVYDMEIPASVADGIAAAAMEVAIDHIEITVHATCPACTRAKAH